VRLPANLALIAEVPFEGGPQTESRLLVVLVGEPAWDWWRPIVRVAPAGCDPDGFRAAATRWMREVIHPYVTQVFHVEDEGEPYALLEYGGDRTLATLLAALAATGARLARDHAEHIADVVDLGLRTLYAAGLAHGDLRAERITISSSGEVKLAFGSPWDARATADGDLRASRGLRAHLRDVAIDRPPASSFATFVGEVCGPEPDPFRGALPPRKL
jgi:hypothetical protein